MNILIIDDHALFREGLRLLLSGLSDELIFHEANGVGRLDRELVEIADLILLDLATSDSTGVNSLSAIRAMEPKGSIVIISGENDPEVIRHCIDHGAAGYIPKSSLPPILIAALRLVLAGGIYLPPESNHGSESVKNENINGVEALTRRQCHALLLAARGQANKTIAREMNISEGTVKLHLSAAYRALGVSNRTEAVFLLSESGMTDADLQVREDTENIKDAVESFK